MNSGRDIEVFTEAVQLPIADRRAFLDRVCAEDEDLRHKVEALLKSNDRAGAFLEEPPATAIGEERSKIAPGERPGDQVDRYELLQQIGEGGCGVVFVAEQRTPVLRRVALKVVKPGMDTKSVIARFEAERQALALMDHPNIAHVFDAGATKSGRPYFVMELVEGVKITDYCDRHSLPIRARLELFVQVCDAIQHAHQKGIIHRDIKPSNILVTTRPDGKTAPKVIDFGIAKATNGQQLTDKTIFTACEMLIGTPAYMSPEQAALTSADVDTRTDIYSLGVLLYELLTGTTPFDTRELLKAGFDEVRRVIRDKEPARPSSRLSTMVAADQVNVSKHHGAEAPKLIREIRGDLDWIVMKALEKDRTRRYATANGLAMDIGRYLAGDAVLARPPSRLYHFQKLISRHRPEFAVFGIVVATLVGGLGTTTWSLSREKLAHHDTDVARREADHQRKKAETGERHALTEAMRSQQVTEFLKRMLSGVHPATANGRDTRMLREILDTTVTNMNLELTNQPAVQADLKKTIGTVYIALGQGDKAEPLIRDALAYYRKFPSGAEQQISDALSELCLLHMHQRPRRLEEAGQEIREALDLETKLSGEPNMRLVVLNTRLAWVKLLLGNARDAENIFSKALVDGEHLAGHTSQRLLSTRGGLAGALLGQDKFDQAEKVLRESLSIERATLGPEHVYVANDLFRLAAVLESQRQFDQAEEFDRQCLAIRRKTLEMDHPGNDEALALLARVLVGQRKMAQAADTYRELLNVRHKKFGDHDAQVLETVDTLAGILVADRNQSQFDQLASEFPEAWAAKSEDSARHGQWSEAVAAASRLVELRPGNHTGYHLMAPLLVQTGERAAYEELCVSITTRFAGATDPYTADRMAKDCLILPRIGADLKVPGELAETAVTRGQGDSGALPFFQCCKALAEFRLGLYDEAINWAHLAARGPHSHSRAEAAAIAAMSKFKLNQVDQARTELADCNKVIEEKLPKSEKGDLGSDWRDWIIAHTLQSEAKRMIEGETSSAARP